MPTVRIPLGGSFNQRGLDGSAALAVPEDQRFLNCSFDVVTNAITGKSTLYVEKRPGWGVDSIPASGSASTGLIRPQSFIAAILAYGETNSTVYHGTISVGVITGRALHFTETLISGVGCVPIKSSDGTGWYYMDGAKDTTAYTGNTISGDFRVTTAALLSGMYSGQLVTGGQMGAGARVTSVNLATSTIGLSVAATATSTGSLLTKEAIAKILDADFAASTVYQSAFAPMDGYLFYATDNGYVNNSDLNSVSAYTANARIAVQQSPDSTVAVAVQKNILVAFGTASNEKFQNAGFATAPLQVVKSQVDHVGALDQRSITTIEDDIYFVSTPSEGDVGVYRMRTLQSTTISPPHVNRIIGTAASNGAIYASSFRLGGYPYAAFTLSTASDGPSSNLLLESGDVLLLETTPGGNLLLEDTAAQSASFVRQLVYNAALNIWGEWDCDEATFIDSVGTGTANQLVATSRFKTDGKVYSINPVSQGELYTDDGVAYSMQIRTSRIDHGTPKKKYVEEIVLVCDRQSAGTATLECSDDDYGSWTTLGTFDLTLMEPKITRCGSYYGGRAYRLTHSYNGPFRGEALVIRYTEAPF